MNIYVGNLTYSSTEDEIRDYFAEFGQVESASIIIDRATGRSKGFGFVVMPDDEEARKAMEELDGKEFQGRTLKINEARKREDKPARPGSFQR